MIELQKKYIFKNKFIIERLEGFTRPLQRFNEHSFLSFLSIGSKFSDLFFGLTSVDHQNLIQIYCNTVY